MTKERLQKILAHAGYGSRRGCEAFIEEGRVTVDGEVATLGDKADPRQQRITLDGKPIRGAREEIYIMLNKPRGVISTVDDPQGRRTVRDLVPIEKRIYPVGRLDANSEGLLLLTNDGELTHRLTHPRYEHKRVYRVRVQGTPSRETLRRWQRGIALDGERVRFDVVRVEHSARGKSWLHVEVHEGRKHLVRRMVAALGHPADRLVREEMGPLRLGDLPSGRWRRLHPHEIRTLKREVKS